MAVGGGDGEAPAATNVGAAEDRITSYNVCYTKLLRLTFVIRSSYRVPFFANGWVWGAAGLSVALQALLMYTPLAPLFIV